MTISSKNVFIVKTDRETFEKSFIRKKNSEIINHYEITQKLIDNDTNKSIPNQEIVEFLILKKINSFKNCRRTEFLFFLIDDLSIKFVDNLKSALSNSIKPIVYHLLSSEEQSEEVKCYFDSILHLENDKN